MTHRTFVAAVLLALVAGCGSPSRPSGDEATVSAVWQLDEDANLAFPTCGKCGADVDRRAASCSSCGASCRVEAKTIACPECDGKKACVVCAEGRRCVACVGSGHCPICDGTGQWSGESCPDCDGAKACQACAVGPQAEVCERCDDSHVCANCEGAGTIVLK
jgi:hypothetical protein